MQILEVVKFQDLRNPGPQVPKHFTKFPKEHPWHKNVYMSITYQQYVIDLVTLKISVSVRLFHLVRNEKAPALKLEGLGMSSCPIQKP